MTAIRTVGRTDSHLSDEARVSVAEHAMERGGWGGRTIHVPMATYANSPEGIEPRVHQRILSRDAEDYVHHVLTGAGWKPSSSADLPGHEHRIKVMPAHWDLREPGSGQAVTDGLNFIGLKGEHTNELALLHESAHILAGTAEGTGGHGHGFQQAAHDLYHRHLGPDAAETFRTILEMSGSKKLGLRQGDRSICPCGIPVEYDEMDGWEHADGSISHDGEFSDESVSDLMSRTAVVPGVDHVERLDNRTAARFTPDKRIFTHTDGLDHRLFDNEHLRPEVRSYILGTITSWWAGEYRDWSKWARVFFAGSEASEWTSPTLEGNNDLDILVGVDYDGCRAANPQLAGLTDQQITDRMNIGFRPHNGPVMLTVDGIQYGPFDRTTFINKDSWDIRRIKPYAAYDVGADSWVVKPPHLPHWSLSELPKPVQQVLRAADSYARRVLKLPEPERTQQGAALFEAWHSDRSRAFGPQGEGWWDIANLREKFGDQAGWWAQLVDCAHRARQGLDAAPVDWSNTPYALHTAGLSARYSDYGITTHRTGPDPQARARLEYVGDHDIPLGDLHTDQKRPLSANRIEFYRDNPVDADPPVEIHDHGGQLWIENGHHRIAGAVMRGDRSIHARLYRSPVGIQTASQPVSRGHRAEQGLAAAPADWSDLPTGYGAKQASYGDYLSGGGLDGMRERIYSQPQHHTGDHPAHILPADWLDGGSRKTAKLPKTQKCDYCEQQATKRVIWAEGMGYIPVCDQHEQRAKDHVGDDYCNTRPIAKTAGAGSPDHRQGYEHGLVGARGNLPYIERTQARGRELEPEDHDYLAGHAAGTQEKQRRDQHRAETGDYKCQQCAGTGMGRWRGTSTCNECQGSGSISQEAAHKTDTLYHVTDNPHFTPNAHHVPEDNTVAIENRSRPGLYAAHKDDVEHWTRGEGYVRPYVAEIHVPHHAHEPGRWGGERFIPAEHFDKVKVTRIIPLSAHGTNYRGPDARDMTPEQHAVHKQHALDTLRDEHDFGPEDIDHLRRAWAAVVSTMYHWAPKDARDDIAQHGLDHTRASDFDPASQGPHGVFFHHSEEAARDWVPDIERIHDLYAVDTRGLNLRPDPYDTGDASYTGHPVSPDRLRRMANYAEHVRNQLNRRADEETNPQLAQMDREEAEDRYRTISATPEHRVGEWGADELAGHVGWVRTDRLGDYREHYGNVTPGSEANTRALVDDFRGGAGWKTPIRLAYNHQHHTLRIEDGNHRLRAAELAGLSHVPAVVQRDDYPSVRRAQFRRPEDPKFDGDGLTHPANVLPASWMHRKSKLAVAGQIWITPQVVMGSAAGLNHARQVNSASEAVAAVQQGLTAVLPPGAWFPVRQVLLGLGMSLFDVTQRLRQFGAPSSVTG